MMRTLAIVFGLLLVSSPVFAEGANPTGELAMHVVASGEYLYCPELTTPGSAYFPVDCLGINNDVSAAELQASFGYAYLVFCCYNVEGITGVEFAVTGVPTTRSGGPLVLSLCPATALIQGNPHYSTGGILAFGECLEPVVPCGGMLGFAYVALGPSSQTSTMGLVSYVPSPFSNAADPHNSFFDCSLEFLEDRVFSEHGCTFNGVHPEAVPYADCHPDITPTVPSTWSNVKAMYR
jgi:hypothetical protein